MAVAILSCPCGVNFSEYVPEIKDNNNSALSTSINFATDLPSPNDDMRSGKPMRIMHVDSNLNLEAMGSSSNSLSVLQNRNLRLYF